MVILLRTYFHGTVLVPLTSIIGISVHLVNVQRSPALATGGDQTLVSVIVPYSNELVVSDGFYNK